MQRISPSDLDNNNLQIGFKGYDRAQVDVLLEKARQEIAMLGSELATAREELEKQRELATRLESQENVLKDTLIIASRAAEEVKSNAQREADKLIDKAKREADEISRQHDAKLKDAEREADKIISQATRTAEETTRQYEAKINDLRWELERLRTDRQKFTSEFRATLEAFMRTLAEENFVSVPISSPSETASETTPEEVESEEKAAVES